MNHEVCYLLIEDSDGNAVAVTQVILATSSAELLFYNGPRLIGDFATIGSDDELIEEETSEVSRLIFEVDDFRPNLYPSLTLGTFGSHFALRPLSETPEYDARELLLATLNLAAEVSRRWQFNSFSLLYLTESQDAAIEQAASAQGLRRTLMGAEGVLAVPAGGFSEYLTRFPKARRYNIRREAKLYAEYGLSTSAASGPDSLTDEHISLRAALRSKYGHLASEEWVAREFETMRSMMGKELVVLTSRDRHGAAMGFLMAFRLGDKIYTRAAGFDYEATEGSFCYFNLCYYDLIQWCAENGISRIHYGLAALDAKKARGCELLPRFAYFALPDNAPAGLSRVINLQHETAVRSFDKLISAR